MLPINDNEIDRIIWEVIHDSAAREDFAYYLVHAPVDARHREEANTRIQEMGDAENNAPVQYARAIDRIRALAEGGDAAALFHMGKINTLGISIKQDLASAVWWYEKAMEAGEPRAFANLGWLYQSGYGVKKDPKKAFELLSAGADGGVISARAAVGMMLVSGEGCAADPENGIRMLEDTFDLGYINAGNLLADICFAGKYVSRDIEKGHSWLFRCTEKGDGRTMAILGHYLVAGTHGRTDVEKGLALLEEATETGFLLAYSWMASLYKNGTGVEKNREEARKWYEKGIAAGSRECAEGLARLLLENRPNQTGLGGTTLH